MTKTNTAASTDGTCIKYIIKKNNRRYGNKSFDTYEQARSYVRKKLRSDDSTNLSFWDNGWLNHSNPSINRYGFSITKV